MTLQFSAHNADADFIEKVFANRFHSIGYFDPTIFMKRGLWLLESI